MRITKHFGVCLLSLVMLGGVFAIAGAQDASAQTTVRRVIYRPVIVRRPYWYYDPFYDPFFYDPRVRAARELDYRARNVDKERRDLEKERAKAMRDGVVTAKEAADIAEEEQELARAVSRLNSYRRAYGEVRY